VLERGEPLELTDDVRALLRRSAREVAIPDEEVEKALRSPPKAKALLRKMHRRIREGANRLGQARARAYRLQDAGAFEEARKALEKVLAVEVVPLYREHAEHLLGNLDRLQAVAEHGRADPHLPERSQVPILLRRIQQGAPLELDAGMRAFLRRAAETVALGEAETHEALTSPEKAGALLGMIMERFREGADRFGRALERMVSLRDSGDLEGARQQMRDVLAVEVVPMYRREAEASLAALDERPPAP
jgi:DUSAM domain-containing protein